MVSFVRVLVTEACETDLTGKMTLCKFTTHFITVVVSLALVHGCLATDCNAGASLENKYSYAKNVAVATEGMLEFMTSDGNVTSTEQFSGLGPVTLDAARGHIYLTDTSHDNSSIFRLDIQSKKIEPLVPKLSNRVQGIAFDPETNSVYWTNGRGRSISMIKADGNRKPTTVITFTEDDYPMGITIDNCKRYVYWTNRNHLRPTIERSPLGTIKREIVIDNDLFQPLGIAVDQSINQLFWSDDREGIFFKIERSNLDGTNRRTVIESTQHQPFALSVGPIDIFWTDWIHNSVWSIPKNELNIDKPTLVRRYDSGDIKGLVAQISTECHDYVPDTTTEIQSSSVMSDSSTISQMISSGCDASIAYCLNSGSFDVKQRECKCLPGYSGLRCEVPACFNFCVHGSCFLDSEGYAQCQCQLGYKGERCHMDVCENYCLNGGRCNVERGGEPVCQCDVKFSGQRCEMNEDGSPTPNDASDNSSTLATSRSVCVANEVHQIIMVVLGSAMFVLAAMIVFLARKVCVLRKRPRIKKHIIVKKNVRPTPLTSRPNSQGEQCEITIENCCNMNICETPCFEPQLRTSKSGSKKTEEKTDLLGNMEESPSSSPLHDDLY